jgi:hypothetical protein
MNMVTFAEDLLRTARQTARLARTHPGFVLTVVLHWRSESARIPRSSASCTAC